MVYTNGLSEFTFLVAVDSFPEFVHVHVSMDED